MILGKRNGGNILWSLLEGREMKIEVNENLECEKEGKT